MIDVNIIKNKMLSWRVHGLRRIIAEKLQLLCILSAFLQARIFLTFFLIYINFNNDFTKQWHRLYTCIHLSHNYYSNIYICLEEGKFITPPQKKIFIRQIFFLYLCNGWKIKTYEEGYENTRYNARNRKNQ